MGSLGIFNVDRNVPKIENKKRNRERAAVNVCEPYFKGNLNKVSGPILHIHWKRAQWK